VMMGELLQMGINNVYLYAHFLLLHHPFFILF